MSRSYDYVTVDVFTSERFSGNPLADFNGGGLSVQDIFDYLVCWFTQPIGC